MIKNEIAPGIMIYDNVIKNSETLINDIEEGMASANLDWSLAGVYTGSKENGDTEQTDQTKRDTMKIGVRYSNTIINDHTSLLDAFQNSLSNIFLESFEPLENDYKNHYGIYTTWHDVYGILKYGVGQKFVNHIDDHPEYHRRVSTLYYINDNYSGGELFFPRFNVTLKPKANQMVIFPSTYVYNHSVLPVQDGTRYSVVSWLR